QKILLTRKKPFQRQMTPPKRVSMKLQKLQKIQKRQRARKKTILLMQFLKSLLPTIPQQKTLLPGTLLRQQLLKLLRSLKKCGYLPYILQCTTKPYMKQCKRSAATIAALLLAVLKNFRCTKMQMADEAACILLADM
ncbi:MAG TPA: hypothetical protein DCZ20_06900, partial [Lachnospiraceae bacterium]|nr:hypothetical protein [Lachnospiraceae bacterium]